MSRIFFLREFLGRTPANNQIINRGQMASWLIKRIFLIIILFLVIYQPPITDINIMNFLIIPAIIYIMLNYRLAIQYIRYGKYIIILFSIALMYLLFLASLKGLPLYFTLSDAYLIFGAIPLVIACMIFSKRNGISKIDLIGIVVFTGFLQGLICLAMLISPIIKSTVIELFKIRGYGIFVTISSWRIFGFADGMTFAMPMVQLIIGLFAMFLGIVKKSRYLVISFIILIPAFVNARITIFIFILLAPMVLITGLRRKKYSISKIVKISILSIATGLMMILLILSIQSPVSRWLGESFQTTLKLVSGEKTATFVDLSKDMVFPSRADSIIFGEGIDLSHQQPGSKYQSDIGWIVNIWKGGLVYSCLVYASLIIIMIKICKLSSAYGLVFCLIVVPTLIIGNTKGIIAGNSPIIVLLLLVYYGIRVSNNAKAVIDEK